MQSKQDMNREPSMFRKGDEALVNCPESVNHGCRARVLNDTGWNCREDIADHPEWREVQMIDGPREGNIGTIESKFLSVVLNG